MTPIDIAPSTREILAARPARRALDPWKPYAYFVEPEHSRSGKVEDVATLFLTNRECPFRCLMCDLWKHTLEETVPLGAIPAQIEFALSRLPPARHIKLYNSGNFFDPKAIPREDHAAIADRVRGFETVIVENHPRLCGDGCREFRELLNGPRLEVAMGLETIHPDVLPRLNKQMTAQDFADAARGLVRAGIDVRAFILLRPPYLTEAEGVEWAVQSMRFAFDCGAGCCAVIPVRGGNGIMERLQASRQYSPPALGSLESVLDQGLAMRGGRVFVDLWGAERFATCPACASARMERLRRINLAQRADPEVACPQCHWSGAGLTGSRNQPRA